jgi:hypothetical protein
MIEDGDRQYDSYVTIVHIDATREIPDELFDPKAIESAEYFVPKETLFGYHQSIALKEIDSRESWPETPEEVTRAYWRARRDKDLAETAVLWPGAAVWQERTIPDEEPFDIVVEEGHLSASGEAYVVPYASKAYYDEHGKCDLKMILENRKSKKGRWYVTSAN